MNIRNQKQIVEKIVRLSLAPIDMKERERIAINYLSSVLNCKVMPMSRDMGETFRNFFDGLEYNDTLKKICFWFNVGQSTKIIHN